VQWIENEAKMVLSSILHEGISPQPPQLPRGDTRTPPGCHVETVDPLTGGQPLLTVGSAVVDRWSGNGSRWSATVDRRWPPLAVVDRWSDGGSDDNGGDSWQATLHHSHGDTWLVND
ncbi:hypothetical protein Tco_1462004, partial [Tanacetum coccineum]